jgi:hypothetical protein
MKMGPSSIGLIIAAVRLVLEAYQVVTVALSDQPSITRTPYALQVLVFTIGFLLLILLIYIIVVIKVEARCYQAEQYNKYVRFIVQPFKPSGGRERIGRIKALFRSRTKYSQVIKQPSTCAPTQAWPKSPPLSRQKFCIPAYIFRQCPCLLKTRSPNRQNTQQTRDSLERWINNIQFIPARTSKLE